MKRNNPETPILIREASGIAPRVWARYEWGREVVAELDGEFICSGGFGLVLLLMMMGCRA